MSQLRSMSLEDMKHLAQMRFKNLRITERPKINDVKLEEDSILEYQGKLLSYNVILEFENYAPKRFTVHTSYFYLDEIDFLYKNNILKL